LADTAVPYRALPAVMQTAGMNAAVMETAAPFTGNPI